MEEQAKIPVFKASLIYGAIVGLATIVFSVLLYFIGQSLETWAMIASIILFVGLLVGALVLLRKEYGKGFISYGRVVLAGLLISLFASILSSGYSYAIYSMDESYFQDTKYAAIDKVVKQFDKMDARYQEKMSDEQYEMFEKEFEKQKKKQISKIKDRSAGSFAFSGIFNIVFMGVIIALIAGIFIKKVPKPFDQQ